MRYVLGDVAEYAEKTKARLLDLNQRDKEGKVVPGTRVSEEYAEGVRKMLVEECIRVANAYEANSMQVIAERDA